MKTPFATAVRKLKPSFQMRTPDTGSVAASLAFAMASTIPGPSSRSVNMAVSHAVNEQYIIGWVSAPLLLYLGAPHMSHEDESSRIPLKATQPLGQA